MTAFLVDAGGISRRDVFLVCWGCVVISVVFCRGRVDCCVVVCLLGLVGLLGVCGTCVVLQ